MKKWLSNIKIPAKLNVMLAISLLSIILIGLIANYFFKTSNVVAFILKAGRIHNVQFHYGIQQFYTYLTTEDTFFLNDAWAINDINNLVMYGYEAIRQIRRTKNIEKIPVLALTAKTMKEDREKCLAAGANDYIAKLVKIEKLLSLMRVWIHR